MQMLRTWLMLALPCAAALNLLPQLRAAQPVLSRSSPLSMEAADEMASLQQQIERLQLQAKIEADTYAHDGPPVLDACQPPACCTYQRHRAACLEAPRTVRTPYAYQPRPCRTYRVPCGAPQAKIKELQAQVSDFKPAPAAVPVPEAVVAPPPAAVVAKVAEVVKVPEAVVSVPEVVAAAQHVEQGRLAGATASALDCPRLSRGAPQPFRPQSQHMVPPSSLCQHRSTMPLCTVQASPAEMADR